MASNVKRIKAGPDALANGDDTSNEMEMKSAENDKTWEKYQLSHVIRENKSGSLLEVSSFKVRSGDEANPWRDLYLTVQATQANVYDGRHLDLAAHFTNATSDHVTKVEDICACCWVNVGKDENEAIVAIGSTDGVIQIISVAECRVLMRLHDKDVTRTIVDLCGSKREPYTVTCMSEDTEGKTYVDTWDVVNGVKKMSFLVASKGEYRRVQYVPSRETIVASTNSEIALFDRGVETSRIELPSKCTDVKFVSRTMLLLHQESGSCCLYDLESKTKRNVFPNQLYLTCITVSPCGKYIAAGDDTGSAYILELDSSEESALQSSKVKSCFMTSCCFGSDAPNQLVCSSADGTLWRWTKNIPAT